MMRERSLVRGAFVVLAFLAGLPRMASAQPALSAKDHLGMAERLQRVHLYEEAALHYQEAMTLSPSSSTLRRLGDVQRQAGDLSGAASAYEHVATMPGASREDKAIADKALRSIGSETGQLMVTSAVPQANVLVDGHPVGTTPLTAPVRVSLGPHLVYVQKDGFESWRGPVNVTPQAAASVTADLQPARANGLVVITESKLRAFALKIDGVLVGKTPYSGELAPGEHTVELAEPKFGSQPIATQVVRGVRTAVVLEAADLFGTLHLKVNPPDAKITIDGTRVAVGTPPEVELAVGKHRVQAFAMGFDPSSDTVEVIGGKPSTWQVSLARTENVDKVEEPSGTTAGGHFDMEFAGAFPLSDRVSTCPSDASQHGCTDGTSLGGGLLFRGGYNFDPLGIEVTALGFGGTYSSTVNYQGSGATNDPPETRFPNTQTFNVAHVGGLFALGASISSSGEHVRLIAGAGGGLSVRQIFFSREVSGALAGSSTFSDMVLGPAGIAHAGVLFGRTPGAKFTLGVVMALEKLDYSTPASPVVLGATTSTIPSYHVLHDVQIYIGPSLGVRFGH
jgi:hypothetical protein